MKREPKIEGARRPTRGLGKNSLIRSWQQQPKEQSVGDEERRNKPRRKDEVQRWLVAALSGVIWQKNGVSQMDAHLAAPAVSRIGRAQSRNRPI
jgi:hypothetical protein